MELKTFEKLSQEVEALLFIDTTSLDKESARTPQVLTGLYALLRSEGKLLSQAMRLQDMTVVKRTRYYSGKATGEEYKAEPLNITINKPDIAAYLNIDEKVLEVRGVVADMETRVKMVEDAIRLAKSRTYDIGNAIKFK